MAVELPPQATLASPPENLYLSGGSMTDRRAYQFKTINLDNGGDVAYIDEGTGNQTLLFIHGLANYALGWQKNIAYFAGKYRCIALDLPGNGYSARAQHPYSISFFADCIADLITKLKLSNLCLIGHSMGGQIAMSVVLKYPGLANKLVLCAPAGLESFTPWERSIYKSTLLIFDLFSSEENSLKKTLHSSFYLFPDQAREMIEELVTIQKQYPLKEYRAMIEACIDGMLHEPVLERLAEITFPTLILFGERDALIPNKLLHPISTTSLAREAVQKFPNAELHILSKCGHFLQWEKAGDVNYYIESFLKRN
jgi:pimeloyl-ACP methyl ester carboxylesterase